MTVRRGYSSLLFASFVLGAGCSEDPLKPADQPPGYVHDGSLEFVLDAGSGAMDGAAAAPDSGAPDAAPADASAPPADAGFADATQDAASVLDTGPRPDATPSPDAAPLPDATGADATSADASGWYGLAGSELVPHATRLSAVPATGGISNSGTYVDGTAVASDRSGRIYVAWSQDVAGSSEIYLRRFDGQAWTEIGGSASGGGVSDTSGASVVPSIAVDPMDRPIVVWQDNTSGSVEIYLKRFDGQAWVALAGSASGGGVSGGAGSSYLASVAAGVNGEPVVAWAEDTPSEIYLRQYDGRAWIELGGSARAGGVSNTADDSSTPSVATSAGGAPVVAWRETSNTNSVAEVYVKRWTGSTWATLAGNGMGLRVGETNSANPVVLIDGDGAPIVAWQAFSWRVVNSNEIHVQRHANGRWNAFPGSVTSGGFYLNGTNYWTIALALDRTGRPIVSWSDNTTGADEVHLARFDGAAWRGLSGSDVGAGVSNSVPTSRSVGITRDADRICAGWTEQDNTNGQIVMRCHALP